MEFQVNDRRSFERFVGLGVMDAIPDATTLSLFREGLTARGGQIIDATLVPVPKQRNRREENEEIKRGKAPEEWERNPNRLRRKDLDAR